MKVLIPSLMPLWGAEGHCFELLFPWNIFARFFLKSFCLQRLARVIVLKLLFVRWCSPVQRKILDIIALILVQQKQQTAIEIVRSLFDLVFPLIITTLNVSWRKFRFTATML